MCVLRGAACASLLLVLSLPAAAADRVEVVLGSQGSGRLLLFAEKVDPSRKAPVTEVDTDAFFKPQNFVAARELRQLPPGQRVALDARDLCHPAWLSQLPPGEYWLQAVLDVDHSYAYSGRGGGDVVSRVLKVRVPLTGAPPVLRLETELPVLSIWELPGHPLVTPEQRAEVNARLTPFSIPSERLSTFMGRPVSMRGLVLTPPEASASAERFPTVYFTHGFGGVMSALVDSAVGVLAQTRAGRLPPMIWVFLDQGGPTGTHEFADSVNNGPWGTALVAELIPTLEARFPIEARPGARFLMGHSSGGWAALWAQVEHPGFFGGAWASSPDFTDFTDFEGIDLTRPGAVMTNLTYARIEAVLGELGGQASSFEWVFSPRGDDGRPMPLYDRLTGRVDPVVAAHWRAHWDLSQRIRTSWPELKAELDGKLHVFVGAEDQFGMDRSTRALEAAVQAVGGRGDFTYLPGKSHFDLYAEGSERMALRRTMAWQMYALARPGSPRTDPGPPRD